MASAMITCSFCGYEFDPEKHPSCATCPLHEGCTMACCPNCGITNINPAGSRLATWLQKILSGEKNNAKPTILEKSQSH